MYPRDFVIGASLVLVFATGCVSESSDGRDPDSADNRETASTATRSPSSGSPENEAGRLATEAYLGMWRAMAAAGETSNWKSPKLSQYATGEALSAISRGMYADRLNGLVTMGTPKNSPKVTSTDPKTNPDTVMISDCGDSSGWLKYRADSGGLADDEPGGRQAITAEVEKQAGQTWKVTLFAVEGVGSC